MVRVVLAATVVLTGACAGAAGQRPVTAVPGAATVATRAGGGPASTVGAEADDAGPVVELDRGELVLTVRGRPAGSEQFTIERHGDRHVIRSEVRLESGSTLRLLDSELITDRDWRPLEARGRDVKDGVTFTMLAGAPLVLTTRPTLGSPSVRTATRAVDLYLHDNTLAHFAPACAVAAPAVRTGFPGMEVRIDADRPTTLDGITRRSLDLAGIVRAIVTCEGGRLLAVELPAMPLVAVRRERRAELAGVLLRSSERPPVANGMAERERVVEVDGARLACTMLLPPVAAQAPAVVLLSGSGAQDRDGDTVGPGGIKLGLLRALAVALGDAGVVSLRCDDRGVAGSTGSFGAATLPTFVADARAMAAALRREPWVDAARVVMVGHSEGALVGAAVAAADPQVAAVAMLGGPGRPVDAVLLEQIGRTLVRGGVAPAEAAAALDRHRAAFAAIRAGAPLPDTDEAREWLGGEAWLRSHQQHDALATVAALGPRPVFLAQGGVDRQVSDVDADALAAAARAGGAALTDRRYPTLDHLFAVSADGSPSAYADPGREVDAALLADLVAFVVSATAAARSAIRTAGRGGPRG